MNLQDITIDKLTEILPDDIINKLLEKYNKEIPFQMFYSPYRKYFLEYSSYCQDNNTLRKLWYEYEDDFGWNFLLKFIVFPLDDCSVPDNKLLIEKIEADKVVFGDETFHWVNSLKISHSRIDRTDPQDCTTMFRDITKHFTLSSYQYMHKRHSYYGHVEVRKVKEYFTLKTKLTGAKSQVEQAPPDFGKSMGACAHAFANKDDDSDLTKMKIDEIIKILIDKCKEFNLKLKAKNILTKIPNIKLETQILD